jgi:antitoxin ParD1/3/4/toxin ParE1/3/4
VKRYILAPAAARDLVEIWRYITEESSRNTAERVESVIREKLVFLAGSQGAGHRRRDLTSADVRFFPVYSYLIVYRPDTKPMQVAAILHGARDVAKLLLTRLH